MTEEKFLQDLVENSRKVVIYLASGFQLHGIIVGYDDFSIFLEEDGRIKMIYKEPISTIDPV